MEHLSARLPAFRITYDNGSSYVTNMANGITLEQARRYFLTGDPVVLSEDEETGYETTATVIRVENEKETQTMKTKQHYCNNCGEGLGDQSVELAEQASGQQAEHLRLYCPGYDSDKGLCPGYAKRDDALEAWWSLD